MFIHLLFISARAATSSRVENNYHPESFFTRFVGAMHLHDCFRLVFLFVFQTNVGSLALCKSSAASTRGVKFFPCIMKCFSRALLFLHFHSEASSFSFCEEQRIDVTSDGCFEFFIHSLLYALQLKQQNRNDLVKRC